MATSNVDDKTEAADPSDVHRTVLLIGKTGNGKSTLANVIVGAHNREPPEEEFEEGKLGGSHTSRAKVYDTDIYGKKYRVVDTIGLCDTVLEDEEVLVELGRTCHYLRNGINQILFVSSGRFTREERYSFQVLRQALFDERVCNYVTIVRTKADYFDDQEMCKKDVDSMKRNPDAEDIFGSVAHIMHIDNPPSSKRHKDTWITDRDLTRPLMLSRLEMCGDIYLPPTIKNVDDQAANYVKYDETAQERIEQLEKDLLESNEKRADLERQLKGNADDYARVRLTALELRMATTERDLENWRAKKADNSKNLIRTVTAALPYPARVLISIFRAAVASSMDDFQ